VNVSADHPSRTRVFAERGSNNPDPVVRFEDSQGNQPEQFGRPTAKCSTLHRHTGVLRIGVPGTSRGLQPLVQVRLKRSAVLKGSSSRQKAFQAEAVGQAKFENIELYTARELNDSEWGCRRPHA
jgi:hypothetical protein